MKSRFRIGFTAAAMRSVPRNRAELGLGDQGEDASLDGRQGKTERQHVDAHPLPVLRSQERGHRLRGADTLRLRRPERNLIHGYEYPAWPLIPAIEAFEALAGRKVLLGQRKQAAFVGLVHPIHQAGAVFGWELDS